MTGKNKCLDNDGNTFMRRFDDIYATTMII